MNPRVFRRVLALLMAALLLPAVGSAQAPTDELLRPALLGILGQYFDPSSVFDISAVGATVTLRSVTIDDLLIIGRPAVMRGISAEFLLHVTRPELDVAALARREPKILSFGRATLVARSTARAVQDGLARLSADILNPQVHFQTGEFTVTATVRREGRLYPVLLRGRLEVENGQRVTVRVAQAQVSGGDVPVGFVARELARFDPLLDLTKWPLNLRVERLILHNDAVELLLTGQGE